MNWTEMLKALAPIILGMNPKTAKYVPIIVAGMEIAEDSQRPGAEKRQIGRDAVKLTAEASNTAANRELVPVEEALSAYDESVDTVVQVVNLAKKIQANKKLGE